MISDGMILLIGAAVFGLALIGIGLTIWEFRSIPRRQKPVHPDVAFEARPKSRSADRGAQRFSGERPRPRAVK